MTANFVDDDVLALDFYVRSLVRDSELSFEDLADKEAMMLQAARELDTRWADLDTAQIVANAMEDLHDFAGHLGGSEDPSTRARFIDSASKVGPARLYDFSGGIVTVGATALMIILALRLRLIVIDKSGCRVVMEKSSEPLSAALKGVRDLILSLWGGQTGGVQHEQTDSQKVQKEK